MKRCAQILVRTRRSRERAKLEIYSPRREQLRQRGSLSQIRNSSLALFDGDLLLIDECLTPDSSRFWPKDQYALGQSPPSFDKQFVRDYLETLDWDKTPPAPRLPKDVMEKKRPRNISKHFVA